jgi:hypothetical protein
MSQKLLVCDPTSQHGEQLTTFLRSKGVSVVSAKNGYDFMLKLRGERPDYVLLGSDTDFGNVGPLISLIRRGVIRVLNPQIFVIGDDDSPVLSEKWLLSPGECLRRPLDHVDFHRRFTDRSHGDVVANAL